MWRQVLFLGLIISISSISATAGATIYVVKPDGTGDFPTIQEAIDAVQDGDIIELTDGTFVGDGNRDINYGGKAITVRSQSGNPEACVINPEGVGEDPHPGFVFISGEGPASVLEGVTITNGHGLVLDSYRTTAGGGMYCNGAAPTLANCVFYRNYASLGGGLYCYGSSPTLTNCTFSYNSGHGVYSKGGSSPTFTNCTFSANSTAYHGGGIYCGVSSPATLLDCLFSGNMAGEGGGMFCYDNASTLTNCIFHGNIATYSGGAMRCEELSPITITNCTFLENSAPAGGGLFTRYSSLQILNCTFYGNSATGLGGAIYFMYYSPVLSNTIIAFSTQGEAIYCNNSTPTLTCCDLYGNAGGDWVGDIADQFGVNGNISEYPIFCNPGEGNFQLGESSPCAPFSPPNPECDLIGAWPVGCPDPEYACCVGEECQILSWADCSSLGGEWLEGTTSCDPNPCIHSIHVVNPEGTGEFPTIQAAIDAAEDRWIIELTDGTYTGAGNRDIDYLGKAITIRSQSGDPRSCIINCQGSGCDPRRGFHFHSGEGIDSKLISITITNGYVTGTGDERVGGGLVCFLDSSPTLTNIIFSGNHAYYGGGANCTESSPTLTECTFVGNSSTYGGGLNCFHAYPHLVNCTFYDNSADYGGGVRSSYSSPELLSTIVAGSTSGAAVFCENGSATLACCDLFGNVGGDWVGCVAGQLGTNGNISEDPLLCDPDNGDFHLQEGSPCAPFSPPNPDCDLIGAWSVGCDVSLVIEPVLPLGQWFLAPSRPNPFASTTSVAFNVPTEEVGVYATLDVYDAAGRHVRTLVAGCMVPGLHSVSWDGTDRCRRALSGGIYFYRLTVGGRDLTKSVTLVR